MGSHDLTTRARSQFAECGAAYHVNDQGVSQAALQQKWCVQFGLGIRSAPC